MQLKMHFVCNALKINTRIFRSKIGAIGGRFEARFLPLVAVSLPCRCRVVAVFGSERLLYVRASVKYK